MLMFQLQNYLYSNHGVINNIFFFLLKEKVALDDIGYWKQQWFEQLWYLFNIGGRVVHKKNEKKHRT